MGGDAQQSPWSPLRPPPLLGEHSEEMLAEAGYSPQQIREMLNGGATRSNDSAARRRSGSMTTVLKAIRQDARLVLTIDRPERRNALNTDVTASLQQALDGARADRALRAIVLTGAGDEAFCAGADVSADPFAFDYATPSIPYANLLA
jgi:hypothetical protein